jgi:flagellar biosynthesis protein FlhG
LAVNLAVALSASGRRVVLVDADSNRADVGALCQLDQTALDEDAESLQTGPAGLQVLLGDWAATGAPEVGDVAPVRLLSSIRTLGKDAEFAVLDVGSGVHRVVREFWRAADAIVSVSTPDPVAVMDTYAAIKLLAGENLALPVYSIINMADDARSARETQQRLLATCRRFLGLNLIEAGCVPRDEHVAKAGRLQRPFVLEAPQRGASACLAWLAELIAAGRKNSLNPATVNNR